MQRRPRVLALAAVNTERRESEDFATGHLRWKQMRRRIAPRMYALEPRLNPALWCPLMLTRLGAGLRHQRQALSVPLKDLLVFGPWVVGAFKRSVHWRGNSMQICARSRLVPTHQVTPARHLQGLSRQVFTISSTTNPAGMRALARRRFSRLKQQALILLACLTGTLTCAPVANLRTHTHTETPARLTQQLPQPIDHIVLLTTDGVRWQDVFGARGEEELPTLSRLADSDGAAVGAPGSKSAIRASGPEYLSLPGYRELLLGHAPTDCGANDCSAPEEAGLVEQLLGEDPGEVAVFASWPTVGDALRPGARAVVSTGRKHLLGDQELEQAGLLDLWRIAQQGTAKPGWGNYRPDAETAQLGVAYLKRRHPRFLFLSLGDTDEYAHQGKRDQYWQALRSFDRTVASVERILNEFAEQGARTLLLVTTDHGRAEGFSEHGAEYPESSRVWLLAGGTAVRARGAIESPRERRLRDIAPTVLLAAGRAPDASHDGEPLLELF